MQSHERPVANQQNGVETVDSFKTTLDTLVESVEVVREASPEELAACMKLATKPEYMKAAQDVVDMGLAA
jgi:hypothetical protein